MQPLLVSSLAGLALAHPLGSVVPRASDVELSVRDSNQQPDARRLEPLTNWNGIGDRSDPALYDTEELFWGDDSRSYSIFTGNRIF
jgi:hypothetical protein